MPTARPSAASPTAAPVAEAPPLAVAPAATLQVRANAASWVEVVDAGGQNLFIGPDGRGNPHLTDQTMMHETNELKKIELSPDRIRKMARSTTTLEYRPPAR